MKTPDGGRNSSQGLENCVEIREVNKLTETIYTATRYRSPPQLSTRGSEPKR